ncbi:MAG: YeeE/YedE family protein [Azospirillaceae bacterium]
MIARTLIALVAGTLFGVGLTVSQMIDPAKVQGFLDVAGSWDPSLAFVLGGALVVSAVGFWSVWRRPRPVLDSRFHVPTAGTIDRPLLVGSALFGVGWGMVGFCPGPALANLALGGGDALVFLAAMVAGMGLFEGWRWLNESRRTSAA